MMLFTLLLLALALDAALTLTALHLGARETTPLMRWLFGIFGPVSTLLMTHVGIALLVWKLLPRIPDFALGAVALGWWLVVLSNLITIVRQRRARS